MAQPKSTDRTVEFHLAAGHPGPADGCQDCAAQLQRQRSTAATLRRHQREVGRRIGRMLESR